MSIITLLNAILGLFSKFVEWGASKKIFKENEAIIVSKILSNAIRDIQIVKETNARLDADFKSNPDRILQDDRFTRD